MLAALLIERELQLRRLLKTWLVPEGYQVIEASGLQEGEQLATAHSPDLVLLDQDFEENDAIGLIKRLRAWSAVPIVVISALSREDDTVAALDAGADVFLTKPLGMRELVARIRVAQRHRAGLAGNSQGVILTGHVRIDVIQRDVRCDGVPVHLTDLEYRLLLLLARSAGHVLSYRQILTQVWGPCAAQQPHLVQAHVAMLRRKIDTDPARAELLITEKGIGYRLRNPTLGRTAARRNTSVDRRRSV